jgi:hypothetical protein
MCLSNEHVIYLLSSIGWSTIKEHLCVELMCLLLEKTQWVEALLKKHWYVYPM